ncbi:DUF4402 domain-containing protein [Chlorobium phaeovibrioides]|uniref:DUF4402 domain-containing protein n=1 Tax=Chlorobium phaeovibrioides TaxID=1094 RepID=UPI001230FFB4|nr:DUF4402 domain-containing protein [Chlorobium phaeovibrioides]QEQ57014.1 DUF4402 domain-containing protein [Chlorobium phaeovibrioides]
MKQKKLLAVAALLSMSAFGFGDAHAATATGNAFATISKSIQIRTVDTPLNFGTITPSASVSGTVTVAAGSAVGATPTTENVTMASVTACSPGHFEVSGDQSASYALTLQTGTIDLTRTGGTETMTVGSFTSNESGEQLVLDSSTGLQTLAVGATLTVGANQYSGEYRGSYEVAVVYN